MMLLFLFSLLAQAGIQIPPAEIHPPVIVGSFRIGEAYQVLSHLRWEKVSTATPEGEKRKEELEQDLFVCWSIGNFEYNCSKHLQDLFPQEVITQALAKKWQNLEFDFYPPVEAPKEVFHSDFYRQFSVAQKVVLWQWPGPVLLQHWNPMMYAWTQGFWKGHLKNEPSSGPLSFALTLDPDQISFQEMVDLSQGPVMDRYYVKLRFERKSAKPRKLGMTGGPR